MVHTHEFEVGGKSFYLESGRVAKQAGGAVLVGMGETIVLGVATMSENPKEGIDFLPLTCDYEERKYAVGKIPGGFIKRGGRPSEKAILTSRLIDRPVRPLFPKGLRNDINVTAMPFSVDPECPPDVIALNAAGCALALSDIPFQTPVAGVRVGRVDGELVLFPSLAQQKLSDLDLVVAGHQGAISMVEAGASFVSEEDMQAALEFAHDAIRQIAAQFEEFAKTAGKPKREVTLKTVPDDLKAAVKDAYGKTIEETLLGVAANTGATKNVRNSTIDDLIKTIVRDLKPGYADRPDYAGMLGEAADSVVKGVVRSLIIEGDKRPDGRALDEIRPLEAVAGLLPRVHGSGLFTRGQTQVMTVVTLGLPGDAQTIDGLEDDEPKRYMHFYNFPSYSVGEVRPNRGPGRREIGHGALAERALRPVIPFEDPNFPYTLLLISETLESNGSTSMASVCGSTLALMDAGIKIKAPVAGIAMGLMSDGKTYKVLTDIQGMEDFCGDMDFKVAGTKDGITALQLDTKLDGIPADVLARALQQAKTARLQILDVIEAEIPAPRETVGDSAPQVTTITINPEKIGAIIGPGGSVIKKLVAETGASIDVQQDGRVLIGANNGAAIKAAEERIREIIGDVPLGTRYDGAKVVRIMGKGALVEFAPGREGLVPKEQITTVEIGRIEEAVNIGDLINVAVHEVDAMGRINLTAIGLSQTLPALAGNEGATPPPPRPQEPRSDRDRGDRGGDRGGRGGGGGDRGGDRGGRGGYGRGGGDRNGGDRSGDRGGRDRGPRDGAPRDGGSSGQSGSGDSNGGGGFGRDSAPSGPRPDRTPRAPGEELGARFRDRQ